MNNMMTNDNDVNSESRMQELLTACSKIVG